MVPPANNNIKAIESALNSISESQNIVVENIHDSMKPPEKVLHKRADAVFDTHLPTAEHSEHGAGFTSWFDLPLPKWMLAGFVQNILVGCIAFCLPGMFNALQGLGKAGGDDETIGAAMNAILYACFTLTGLFSGSLFNLLGNKILMAFGGSTYAMYAIAVYLWGHDDSFAPLGLTTAGLLGVGAGCLWTAQGVMTLTYSTKEKKGLFTAIFWAIFNLGGVFGGLLTFAIEWPAENSSATADTNTTESVNEISPVSYFVLVGVMCLGVLCAMLLLVHPSKVTKSNGEKVHIEPAKPFQEEIADTFSLLTNAKMWLLSLLFVQSNWYYTFEFNAINGSLFQPASRGLNSAMYWSMQMLGSIVTGAIILDRDWGSIRNSAVFGLAFVGVVNIVQWSLTAYYQFANGYARGNFPESLFSITTGGSDYWVPAALFAFMGFADACVQTYAYWIIGSLSDSTNITSQYFGYYKAVQSLGAAVAWGIEFGGVSYDVQMVICTVLAVVCLPPAYVVALRLTDLPAVPTAAGDIVRFPIDDTHNGLQHVFLDTLED